MNTYEKPDLGVPQVDSVLREYFGSDASGVTQLNGAGNWSSVFSFSHNGREYVIKFSDFPEAYETERFIANLLSTQGIPFPKCLGLGKYETMNYVISEKISGHNLVDCSPEQKRLMLPELIQTLTSMNHVELGETSGYGWINSTGDGTSSSWREYLIAFFAVEQTGFWEGWHDLYKTTCLEKDVFDECYNRLMTYVAYNEPHRYFIHGDFHPWNILSDGQRITGIIDGNCKYGDFLVDIVTLDRYMKEFDVIQVYQDYQQQMGIVIPNFMERVIGAKYYMGLDGLRFFAKMGWNDAYFQLRNELLSLPK